MDQAENQDLEEENKQPIEQNNLDNIQNEPAKEEEQDDFPDYANEQNKQLNEIIKEKKRIIKELSSKIDEKVESITVLKDHFNNVQQELLHIQALYDAKNKEIETEDHLKQITERQTGRLKQELQKSDKLIIGVQEKLNDIQNQVFKGNEKMDQFKLEMNWNQEELEQWALAARQKEEDNLTLEKYKRADEVKIKELNLGIEKLTAEVTSQQQALQKEATETQAYQIELDKTSEEFKKQHEERHQLFNQWKETTQIIQNRDQSIREQGEEFARIKMEINSNKDNLEEKKQILKKSKEDNKGIALSIELLERQKINEIQDNKDLEEQNRSLQAEVEIQKNQVSAYATDLANKRNRISVLTQERLIKKQRLNAAQQKYNAHLAKMKNEDQLAKQYVESREKAEERYKENMLEKNTVEKDIRTQKEQLFKCTQDLFKLREKEANLYGEIQQNMAACRNLQAHINNLNQEFQRQQELLYNAEYQIQLMERKVARAKGDRTVEEKKELEAEIEIADKEYQKVNKEHTEISESLKKLDDDLRTVEKKLRNIRQDQSKYQKNVEQLQLENDMTYQDLNKIIKRKEDVLVQHDTMKLEIKKIQQVLSTAVNTVFTLENNKYQLEMSMQEREKEIQVHKDVLLTEHKAAEEERHKIAVELAERENRVKNLRIKYESLVQKNKANNGEIENVNEHSQAYYVIKAAQEKEELQRKGDELNAKILKSEKELKGLDNTLNHLKNWNSKYWDSFVNKGADPNAKEQKSSLEEQTRAASENLFKKKKELQKLQKELEEDNRRLNEIMNKINLLENQKTSIQLNLNKSMVELEDQQQKLQRAESNLQKSQQKINDNNIKTTEENPHIVQMLYERESNLTKTLITCLCHISEDVPEIANIVEDLLKEQKIQLPSKPPSSIDVRSQAPSEKSIKSQQSQKK